MGNVGGGGRGNMTMGGQMPSRGQGQMSTDMHMGGEQNSGAPMQEYLILIVASVAVLTLGLLISILYKRRK